MSVAGSGSIRDREGGILIGSGVASGSSCVGSGTFFYPLKWSECDTVAKMVGFVVGKIVNVVVVNSVKLFRRVVQLFYLDKISRCFFRLMCHLSNTLHTSINFLCECASKYLKPLFINRYSKTCSSWVYTTLLLPIGKVVNRCAECIFKTILWESICSPLYRKTLQPFFSWAFSSTSTSTSQRINNVQRSYLPRFLVNGLQTLSNWTLSPLCEWVILPALNLIGDVFYGIFSGALRESPPPPNNENEENQGGLP